MGRDNELFVEQDNASTVCVSQGTCCLRDGPRANYPGSAADAAATQATRTTSASLA